MSSIAMPMSRMPTAQCESSNVATTAIKTSKGTSTIAAKKTKAVAIGKGESVKVQERKLKTSTTVVEVPSA